MSTNTSIKRSWIYGAAIVLLLCGVPAQASTYHYAFTTNDLLQALSGNATCDPTACGWFAIFLQPNLPDGSFNYSSMSAPNSLDPDAWIATTSIAYSPGIWLQFSIDQNQTSVSLVSEANGGPGGTNIFLSCGLPCTYSDNTPWPIGFDSAPGPSDREITSIIPIDGVFQFDIVTEINLGNVPLTFTGFASGIHSGSTTDFPPPFLGTKTDTDVPFALELTATPEPGSLALMFIGAAAIAFGAYRKRIPG